MKAVEAMAILFAYLISARKDRSICNEKFARTIQSRSTRYDQFGFIDDRNWFVPHHVFTQSNLVLVTYPCRCRILSDGCIATIDSVHLL